MPVVGDNDTAFGTMPSDALPPCTWQQSGGDANPETLKKGTRRTVDEQDLQLSEACDGHITMESRDERLAKQRKRHTPQRGQHELKRLTSSTPLRIREANVATAHQPSHPAPPAVNSRLFQELHEREHIRGLDRAGARQLLQDKLVFRGDTDIDVIRKRRFCVLTLSNENYQFDDLSIPSEVTCVSMEQGKICSALRLEAIPGDNYSNRSQLETMRVKRLGFNPSSADDVDWMYRSMHHFFERCMDSLILVPACQFAAILHWLRQISELRTTGGTPSICLSRVMCVEDFIISIQELNGCFTVSNPPPTSRTPSFESSVQISKWLINALRKCAAVSKNEVETTHPYRPQAWLYENGNEEPNAQQPRNEFPERANPFTMNHSNAFVYQRSASEQRIWDWVMSVDPSITTEDMAEDVCQQLEETLNINPSSETAFE
ncbi:unnamed protein product [Caenorhabditis auriculariae]|uniref:Uncharacterized protein n=1 Tax=Caenorhabditis auriculariae TaxID=2777116 RepID=A0A8S1GS94_9PELO|nr:unnamed protein product [Caenorhabditis auriculariae]